MPTEKNVADPAQYDIVINTKMYTGERADALVLMAYLSKFGELPLAEHTRKFEVQASVPSSRPSDKLAGDR